MRKVQRTAQDDEHPAVRPLWRWLARLAFGLVLAIAGLMGGWVPLISTLHAVWEVRSWGSRPIEVLDARLDSSNTGEYGTTVYQLYARYRYTVNGQAYESSRVGLDTTMMADSLDDWHHVWARRLKAAQAGTVALHAWVDPRQPRRAVLDRQIRWPVFLTYLLFALTSAPIGLVILARTLKPYMSGGAVLGGGGKPRAEVRPRSADYGAQSTAFLMPEHRATGAWFLAVLWCGLIVAMANTAGRIGVLALVASAVMLPLGLMLWWQALRQTVLAWRYAGSRLQMHPARPWPGQPLELSLHLSPRATASMRGPGQPAFRLVQSRLDESDSGGVARELSRLEQPAQVQDMEGQGSSGMRLHARFELPAGAIVHGSLRNAERVEWRIFVLDARGREAQSFAVSTEVGG